MTNFEHQYIIRILKEKALRRRIVAIIALLALLVGLIVYWSLRLNGVALANEYYCGAEEHCHCEACYDADGGLICGLEEHTHTVNCLSNESADLETEKDWEATLPQLSGVWTEDLVAVAESQLGYTESADNYILADDGVTRRGYTRYGAWAGNSYGVWDAMFVSFCLRYAEIPAEDFPKSTGAYAWSIELEQLGLFEKDCALAAGELVFFDKDGDGRIDRVGVAADVEGNVLTVIEGDYTNDDGADAVCFVEYNINNTSIVGCGVLPEQTEKSEAATPDEVSSEVQKSGTAAEEQKSETTEFKAEDGGIEVNVLAPSGALPDGAELVVTLYDAESDEYLSAVETVGYDPDGADGGIEVIDICFVSNGKEVEPSKAVSVSIDASAVLPEKANLELVQHLEETDDGINPIVVADLNGESGGTIDGGGCVAEFEVESFSSFTVKWGSGSSSKSLTVNVYLDGASYSGSVSNVTLSSGGSIDLTTLLDAGSYAFSYASVTYTSSNKSTTTTDAVSISYSSSRYTITLSSGSAVTATAVSSVSVYYVTSSNQNSGDGNVTFSVLYPNSSSIPTSVGSGVTVYVYSSDGSLLYSGTTNSKGQVTFSLADGETYIVKTSDYSASNYTYSFSGSITADANNGNIISLVRSSSSAYDHIDIKYVSVSNNSMTLKIQSIDSAVVYDSDGNIVYTSSKITANSTEQNWQCFWGSSSSHSLSFYTSYSVEITFTDTNGETYTATVDSSTTYPEGCSYPVTASCAYHLYNYIYGTSYTNSTWESSSDYSALKETGIDISGLTYYEVAIVLCDSWGATQNGLDFAFDLQSLLYLSDGWDFEVQKTYVNNSMESGEFTFNLYEASVSNNIWRFSTLLQSRSNSAAAVGENGNSQDTVSFDQISYSKSDAGTYYYIINESVGSAGSVTYDETIYGVKVVVTVGTGTASSSVIPTYYILTAVTDSSGNITGYTAAETTVGTSSNGLDSIPFTNTYRINTGYRLPSAGGIGTKMYVPIGLIFVIFSVAAALKLTRRQKKVPYTKK